MKFTCRLIFLFGLTPLAAQVSPLAGALLYGQTAFGVHGFLVLPQSDLHNAVNGRPGFQAGIHADVALDTGRTLRPELDYARLDGGSFSLTNLDSTVTVQETSLGADFLLFPGGDTTRGGYGMAGAGLAYWAVENRFTPNDHLVSPYGKVGAGFRFGRNLAVEANLGLSRFRTSSGDEYDVRTGFFYTF